jgi:8-oxo-dGTP pyrophosphatase MutT (NUDIX family)
MSGWMIDNDDPARLEIVERAKKLGITGNPDKASHDLGDITLKNGKKVHAFVVHAVDPIITDKTDVVMINRAHEPGLGKPALPGGLIDPLAGGGVETAIDAGIREALEEAGIDISKAPATLLGTRNLDRPFDVRVATGAHIYEKGGMFEKYGIREGDIFMVSTQAVRFDVPDLSITSLFAGDDALPGTARRVALDTLSKPMMGIPDHFDMVAAAIPEHFPAVKPASPKSGGPSLKI